MVTAAAAVFVCGLLSPAALSATPIQRENALAGTFAWNGPGSGQIELYASQIGVAPGEPIEVHVSTRPAARYRISVYRLGWYGGEGGRLVACVPSCTGDEQGHAGRSGGPSTASVHTGCCACPCSSPAHEGTHVTRRPPSPPYQPSR